MTQVIKKQGGGGYIIWDESDWGSGFIPQGGQGNGQTLKGNGNMYSYGFDPYRVKGVASPGYNPSTATNQSAVTGTVIATAVKTASLQYGVSFESTASKIHEHNYATNTITNGGSFPHTISHGAHANEKGTDIIIYRHKYNGSFVTSLFYSFYDDTDWDIGCYEAFSSFEDDFMTVRPGSPLAGTDLTGGALLPHPLEIGADDVLYAGSGRYLHGYDGAGSGNYGNFLAELLTLPAGFVIMDLLKTEQYLLIAGCFTSGTITPDVNTAQEALVYTWNYIDQDVTDVISLNDPFVSVLKMWRNRPTAITGGPLGGRGRNRVKVLTGSNAETVAEYDGEQPSSGGVDTLGSQMLINSAGKIVAIGTPFSEDTYEVNNIGATTATTASGFIRNSYATGKKIFASAGAEFVQLNTGYYADSRFESGYTELVLATGKKARAKALTTTYIATVNGNNARNFAAQLIYDYGNNSSTVVGGANSIASANLIDSKRLDNTDGELAPFYSVALVLVWVTGNNSTDAARPSKVVLEYEEVDYDAT